MTEKREALQRGQRGRGKLGKKEMESCWMEDREREGQRGKEKERKGACGQQRGGTERDR